MGWYGGYGDYAPYVPVAKRRANAARYAARIAKKEKRTLCPVEIEGRKIANSFWGAAWCENLERYSDFANRLPRGRTYARNGSVVDLQMERGVVKAIVAGSEVYRVQVKIATLKASAWKRILADCSQSVDSLLDLLQGRFDEGIMRRLTEREGGLFPKPNEISMSCSCPDWAGVCKHVAATLYGVGARLDSAPELLFALRDVDHTELVRRAMTTANLDRALNGSSGNALASDDLGEIFGIELDAGTDLEPASNGRQASRNGSRAAKPRKSGKKKAVSLKKVASTISSNGETHSAKRKVKKKAVKKKASTKGAKKAASTIKAKVASKAKAQSPTDSTKKATQKRRRQVA